MASRPTIKDIAKEAGVSIATVNRVLAGNVVVREETGRRVSEAAHRIGYHGTNLIEQRLRTDLPRVRFGFVFQKERQSFYQLLAEELEATASQVPGVNAEVFVEFAPSQSPRDVSAAFLAMSETCDVIGATAVNHHQVNDAVRALSTRGIPTIAMLSDFAQGERINYIGFNNLKVGRGAAWLLSSTTRKPGKLAIFVGGHRWHGHDLREAGFRSFFREHLPRFDVLDTLVNLETQQLTHEATLDLLSRHPDIVGIYVAGGGMEGAISALREERKPREVALVVNDLTPDARTGLADGYVTAAIGTPLQSFCSELYALMTKAALGDPSHVVGQRFLEPVLHIPELS
ncbi:MAG: LacI family DNA-binding transcriptional regulator [Pseudomonadota bacterium]